MNDNIATYSRYDPETALLLTNTENAEYQFCYSHRGEINLRCGDVVYHEMDGALDEARRSIENSPLKFHNTLIIYGLGLGYQYLALKDWLEADPKHTLLILEDDIMVIKRFMETNIAAAVLSDPQVVIHYFDLSECQSNEGLPESLKHLLRGTIHQEALMIASPHYSKSEPGKCEELRNRIYNYAMKTVEQLRLLASEEISIFRNFYTNILRLPESYLGTCLKDTFKKIPAIICGAGPSLVQHIDQLRTLESRALIIGSGTGMNVLNGHNMFPHLGIGLDPTSSQGTRIRTNQAFECPYAYQIGFHAESLDLLHGPKIFFHGLSDYPIRRWFIEKLGIELLEELEEGVSSTNLAMGVAHYLGCDPIILLGCDLAYRDDLRYPSGVHAHASDTSLEREKIEYKSQALCTGENSLGEPLVTKATWIVERDIIAKFAQNHPEVEVLNCTEGGLRIDGVEVTSLDKVISEKLLWMGDIRHRLHTEIQGGTIPIEKETCLNILREWQASLQTCRSIYQELLKELTAVKSCCLKGEELPSKPYTKQIKLLEEKLQKEDAYRCLLTDYIDLFESIATREKIFMRCHAKDPTMKQLEIDFNFLVFFMKQVDRHLSLIDQVMAIQDSSLQRGFSDSIPPPEEPPNIATEHTKETLHRPDGSTLCKQSISEGVLHGPVIYYGKSGEVCATSYYDMGKRIGKAWSLYLEGSVCAVDNYRDDSLDGEQLCYYEDGSCKSVIPYSKGKLHGEVRLYYPGGSVKRIVGFHEGLLHGIERYWGRNGLLLWDCEYKKGRPYGVARSWHLNGVMATECEYFPKEGSYLLKEWNEKGQLVYEKRSALEARETKKDKIQAAIREFQSEMHVLEHTEGFYQNRLRF